MAAASNADDTTALRACLNLLRHLPPSELPHNLDALCVLRSDLEQQLRQRVDVPLTTVTDTAAKKAFLLCEYNRDGDSHRSPWSNDYVPPPPDADGYTPPPSLREMEVAANELLEVYCGLYYGGGGGGEANAVTSSAFFWPLGEVGPSGPFGSAWCVKKKLGGGRASHEGSWDVMHVIEARPAAGGGAAASSPGGKWVYKLTSTLLLSTRAPNGVGTDTTSDGGAGVIGKGSLSLAGSLSRHSTLTTPLSVDKGHLAHMGGLLEAMESELRGSLDAVYVGERWGANQY